MLNNFKPCEIFMNREFLGLLILRSLIRQQRWS